jgi:hypothetical protein
MHSLPASRSMSVLVSALLAAALSGSLHGDPIPVRWHTSSPNLASEQKTPPASLPCPVDCIHPKKNATHGNVRPRYFALDDMPEKWSTTQKIHDPRPQDSRPIHVDPLQPRV